MHITELYHHGIKGQKWGIRRYQNKDGTLTPLGRERYNAEVSRVKNKHGSYGEEAKKYSQAVKTMKDGGYEKWAKKNGYDSYSDEEKKRLYDSDLEYYENSAKSAKIDAKLVPMLSKRLDSIDVDSLGYKKAMRMIRQVENEWINEVVEAESE